MFYFYKKFKAKYRNKYYFIKSNYDFYIKYIYFSLIKILLCPFIFCLYPLYKYYYKNNIYFLADIMPGVGHVVPEFDYFYLRYKNLKKVILICDRNKIYDILILNYNFYKIYSGKLYIIFFIQFLNHYPRLNLISSQTLGDKKVFFNLFSNRYNINYYFKYYNRYLIYKKK